MTKLYQAADTDPKSVTKTLLATHRDAQLSDSAQLTLPAIHADGVAHAQTLPEVGASLGRQTGVGTVELQRNGDDAAELVGSINPRATFAQLVVNKRFKDAKDYYKTGTPTEVFAIDDITIGGVVVRGLKTTIGLGAAQASRYLDEWVNTGKVTPKDTAGKRYSFKPSPTPSDLADPRSHPEYPSFMAGAAQIPIPAAEADHNWELLIVGLRTNNESNFEQVAANLMRSMSIPPGRGALWSGGEDLSDYAKDQGCATLEQQTFYKATKGLELVNNWSVARKAWASFSRLYASQLRGKTHIYARRVAAGSVLVDIELKKINEMLSTGGIPGGIDLRFHAMEWGDDPHKKLSAPLPGYWRELDSAGNPLPAGGKAEHDQATATRATAIAQTRFDAAQAAKL